MVWNRFFGAIAILFTFLGIILLLISTMSYFLLSGIFSKFVPLMAIFLLLQAGQLFLTGLLAQVISKNYFESAIREPYLIKNSSN